MHFSWEKHLELSRSVSTAADKDQGLALALMGVGLTILLEDLWWQERQNFHSKGVFNDLGKSMS